MKKDVIYVDIEDDITSIIEKVKASGSKIVALVPPKRIGVLQSVVNLKLLQRAAETADKRVVMITNDQGLSALAAGVSMPVAKNLQSKPEIAPIAALDVDEEDVINGDELPIGEHAATAPGEDALIGDDLGTIAPPATPVAGSLAAQAAAKAPRKGVKVPNFEIFRKKMLLSGGLGILLLVFLVWAIFFAGKATVAITAKTNAVNIDKLLQLNPNATFDANQGVVKPVTQQSKKSSSVTFDATGKKDVGEKATGTITLVNNDESDPITVPAGSTFTTLNGRQFTSDSSATVPGFRRVGGQDRPGIATVTATAVAIGEDYNVGAQSLISNDVTIGARFDQATSGGSKRQITVVSDEDVTKAKEQLAAQNADQVKTELRKQFKSDTVIINESYRVDAANPVSAPKVGEGATKATLTAETTYVLMGVKREELKSIFNEVINASLEGRTDQKIYEAGDNNVQFAEFAAGEAGVFTVRAQATGQVGPKIDEKQLATTLEGKRSGEIQELVESIEGVEKVEAKFSPFWVTKAPSADKITVTFVLKNDN